MAVVVRIRRNRVKSFFYFTLLFANFQYVVMIGFKVFYVLELDFGASLKLLKTVLA
jgi:hypothetical protein